MASLTAYGVSAISLNSMPPNVELMRLFGTEHLYREKLAREALASAVAAVPQRHVAWDGSLDRMLKSAEIAMQVGELLAKHGGIVGSAAKGAGAALKLPFQAIDKASLSTKLLGAGALVGGGALAAGHLGSKALQRTGDFLGTPTQDHVAHVLTFDEVLALSPEEYEKRAGITDMWNAAKGVAKGVGAAAPAAAGVAKGAVTGAIGKIKAPISTALQSVGKVKPPTTGAVDNYMGKLLDPKGAKLQNLESKLLAKAPAAAVAPVNAAPREQQMRQKGRVAGRQQAVAQYQQDAGSAKAQNLIGRISGQEPVAMPAKPRTMLAQERLDRIKANQQARAAQTNTQAAVTTGQGVGVVAPAPAATAPAAAAVKPAGNIAPAVPSAPSGQVSTQPWSATKQVVRPPPGAVIPATPVKQVVPVASSSVGSAEAAQRGHGKPAGAIVTPAEAATVGTVQSATPEQPPAKPSVESPQGVEKKKSGLRIGLPAALGLSIAGAGIGSSALVGQGIKQMGREGQLPNVYSNYGAPIAGQASPYGYVTQPGV